MAALTALALGAAAVGAYGSIKAGKSAKKQANFQASATRNTGKQQAGFIESQARQQADLLTEETNARAGFTEEQANLQNQILKQQAERERSIAADEEADYRLEQSRVLAEKRAGMGGSGVRMDTGSPILAVGDFAGESELQARRIRSAGNLTASRLEQEAEIARRTGMTEADLVRKFGKKQAELILSSALTEADLLRSTTGTEASLLTQAGKNAQTAGYFRAGAQILSGAGTAYESWGGSVGGRAATARVATGRR